MKKKLLYVLFFVVFIGNLRANDTIKHKLNLFLPLLDFPQIVDLENHYPSMNQAAYFSLSTYELGYLGIDVLGNWLFEKRNKPTSGFLKLSNKTFKYIAGLAFSKYGSELPVTLGIWAHEEFHRSVLGIEGIYARNGNWIFSRWDGTVYGISDESLDNFKSNNPDQLLYSYVAGVHSEIYLNQIVSMNDFYKKRTLHKNSLLLYNAYYVFDYFKFSTSSISDSVKVNAPSHEDKNPSERDYAGADLTSWAYDMFNPHLPFTSRDLFPNGSGVNRRVGFSDLSADAQDYLKKQKSLSLLNFLNPAIFFINRIKISDDFWFNFFAQYAPTHFGNDVSFHLPLKFRKNNLLFSVHKYSNYEESGYGAGMSFFDYPLSKKLELNGGINVWNQPESFFAERTNTGGSLKLGVNYLFNKNLKSFFTFTGKTKGWEIGIPYLTENVAFQAGLLYSLFQ